MRSRAWNSKEHFLYNFRVSNLKSDVILCISISYLKFVTREFPNSFEAYLTIKGYNVTKKWYVTWSLLLSFWRHVYFHEPPLPRKKCFIIVRFIIVRGVPLLKLKKFLRLLLMYEWNPYYAPTQANLQFSINPVTSVFCSALLSGKQT